MSVSIMTENQGCKSEHVNCSPSCPSNSTTDKSSGSDKTETKETDTKQKRPLPLTNNNNNNNNKPTMLAFWPVVTFLQIQSYLKTILELLQMRALLEKLIVAQPFNKPPDFWNTNVHYHVHKSLLLVHTLNQIYPPHTFTTRFKIYFNFLLPYMFWSPNLPLPFKVHTRNHSLNYKTNQPTYCQVPAIFPAMLQTATL
jgi:hypothetical protein